MRGQAARPSRDGSVRMQKPENCERIENACVAELNGVKNPGMNFRIEHLGLPAKDPANLRNWYMTIMGATPVWDNGQTPPTVLLQLPGGGWIEIYAGERSVPENTHNKTNGWRHVAIRVDSIEAAKKVLEKRGVEFSESVRPAAGGGRVLFFSDPEGNLLHLVEREGTGALGS